MPAINHRIARVLKALEGFGKDQWISDVDLATLSDETLQGVRDTMNTAATSAKYEGVIERDGHPGDWKYRLVGDIDWPTVGSRAGSKNGHRARQLGGPIMEWAQGRDTRNPFSMSAVCKAIKIDNNQARPALARLVQKGQLVPVTPDSWRLADDVELTPSFRTVKEPVPAATAAVAAPERVERLSMSELLRRATVEPLLPPKRTMEELIDEVIDVLADGVMVHPKNVRTVLPFAVKLRDAAEAFYKAVHEQKG